TTKSVVAIFDESGKPVIIPNLAGERTTASYVAVKAITDKVTKEVSYQTLIGSEAKRQAVLNPEGTLYGVKRLIGRKIDDPEVKEMQKLASYKIVPDPGGSGDAWVELNGKPVSPSEVGAKL